MPNKYWLRLRNHTSLSTLVGNWRLYFCMLNMFFLREKKNETASHHDSLLWVYQYSSETWLKLLCTCCCATLQYQLKCVLVAVSFVRCYNVVEREVSMIFRVLIKISKQDCAFFSWATSINIRVYIIYLSYVKTILYTYMEIYRERTGKRIINEEH